MIPSGSFHVWVDAGNGSLAGTPIIKPRPVVALLMRHRVCSAAQTATNGRGFVLAVS